MVRAKESTLKVTACVSFPLDTGIAKDGSPCEQNRCRIQVSGDFADGAALADAVFAKMSKDQEWRRLFVLTQLSFGEEKGRERQSVGASGLRAVIVQEFDGLRRRLESPPRELTE
jgi:hypothetical protein